MTGVFAERLGASTFEEAVHRTHLAASTGDGHFHTDEAGVNKTLGALEKLRAALTTADPERRTLAIRSYVVPSTDFKKGFARRCPDAVAVAQVRLANLPRFVWVVEILERAIARIDEARPDAVTLNETCRTDVARIAQETGYHLRFTRVIYGGERLRCVRPGGRGLFGDAVLTEAAVEGSDSRDFQAQAGPERRRWLCVTTTAAVDVCTAHLNTRSRIEAAGNDAQCSELAALLASRAGARAVIFGGDVNRRHSCAPEGAWTRTDGSAGQAPGLQQPQEKRR